MGWCDTQVNREYKSTGNTGQPGMRPKHMHVLTHLHTSSFHQCFQRGHAHHEQAQLGVGGCCEGPHAPAVLALHPAQIKGYSLSQTSACLTQTVPLVLGGLDDNDNPHLLTMHATETMHTH